MRVADHIASLKAGATVYRAPANEDVRLFAAAASKRPGAHLFVTANDRSAVEASAVARFFEPELRTLRFPAWDCLPYDRVSPSPAIASQRCAVLTELAKPAQRSTLVITTAYSLAQRVPPREHFTHAGLALQPGDEAALEEIRRYLTANGYARTTTVREHGDYSIRGGIVDLYPAGEPEPIRLDFFGDELESIRTFDPDTQRSTSNRKDLLLAPVSEVDFSDDALSLLRTNYIEAFGPPAGDPDYEAARERIRRQGVEHWLPLFYDHLDTLFDYIGPKGLIGYRSGVMELADQRFEEAVRSYEARQRVTSETRTARVLAPDALHLPPEARASLTDSATSIRFTSSDAAEDEGRIFASGAPSRDFAPERTAPDGNLFGAVSRHLMDQLSSRKTVMLAAWSIGSAERLKSFLVDHGVDHISAAGSMAECRSGVVNVVVLPIEQGFQNVDLVVLAEQDILGEKLARPRKRKSSAAVIAEATALTAGDLVVHIEHGVGRYEGLKTVDVQGAAHDCLELVYAGGDKILLPVENVELVSRYGAESGESALDRLGGAGWQSRKARARRKIMDLAEDLIRLAAERELKRAPRMTDSSGVFEEFSARFPYEETDDQLSAIGDVVDDLSSGKPMDRLICGDVGFGKTEVALRAAFLTAASGMQVALIAPTTLLARQHFRTFEERFDGWPIKVRQLSRFVPAKQAAETRAEMSSGECDIVIGTHALLAENTEFKKLGLVIVDEEQRFGVKHKERLKELRADVHVLTMTATPIPRTLQMSLAGIRDLSLIATPPVDRLAIRTYLVEFDPVTIREALMREYYRGGQSYYVAPRIADLPFLERFLRDQLPELKYIVAHGQMSSTELEAAMTAFYDGQADVLLSTTIVESGLDIPRANTMVVHRADMFGLAQLYQLRGRVGRSKLRAYAYLTTPEESLLTDGAHKRLKVLQSLDSLGAGFMLASHDLDMRGGGNLLGEAQSGHIREVGVELYQSMLEDSIRALRSGDDQPVEDWSPQMDIGVSVRIPESYVEDLSTRLSLYRRLADLETREDRDAFVAELVDRFGPLPDETQRLIEITALKALCKKLGIAKLAAGPKGLLFSFRQDTPVKADQIVAFVHQRPGDLKLRPDAKLVATGVWPDAAARMKAAEKLLAGLYATLGF